LLAGGAHATVSIVDSFDINRANWDERVPVHVQAYGVEDFISHPDRISSVVREDLALMAPHLPGQSPAGLSLVHLQCHIGTDTLSWARLGAMVTGVDSPRPPPPPRATSLPAPG